MMNLDRFMSETVGRAYNTDKAYGVQCWDYFDLFCRQAGLPVSRYCALTGYAGDLWRLRDKYGYGRYFTYIYNKEELQDGDWIFWDKHVAIFYKGKQYGQNQSTTFRGVMPKAFNKKNFLGALRFKDFERTKKGVADKYAREAAGQYETLANVNLRTGGGLDYQILKTLTKGTKVQCYGYYTVDANRYIWYYVVAGEAVGFLRGDLVAAC